MQSYLFIGGNQDGLDFPVTDDAEFVQWPVGVTDSETYHRDTLTIGAASITIYRLESLTPEQVLNQVVEYYRAWAANRPLRYN